MPEQPFDVLEFYLDIRWMTVIALPRVRKALHLAQYRIHLAPIEPPASANIAETRGRTGDPVQALKRVGF